MNKKSVQEIFGKNLKRLRKQAQLSQKQLAEIVELPRANLGQIETGKAGTSFAKLGKIATALHCNISELFVTDNELTTKNVDMGELALRQIRALQGSLERIIQENQNKKVLKNNFMNKELYIEKLDINKELLCSLSKLSLEGQSLLEDFVDGYLEKFNNEKEKKLALKMALDIFQLPDQELKQEKKTL